MLRSEAEGAVRRPPPSGEWIAWPAQSETARLRLFILPFAGGGAVPYRLWAQSLPPEIACCPVLLPGREERLAEPPMRRLDAMIEALIDVLEPHLEAPPYAVFGHSFGALAAYELVRTIGSRGLPLPLHLFVSGRRPPAPGRSGTVLHDKPAAALIDRMRRLGGTPHSVLESPELIAMFLPALRADFEMLDTYCHEPGPPLPVPITAFGGTEDPEVTAEELAAWRRETGAACDQVVFPGGHFYLLNERPRLCESIAERLSPHLASAG